MKSKQVKTKWAPIAIKRIFRLPFLSERVLIKRAAVPYPAKRTKP